MVKSALHVAIEEDDLELIARLLRPGPFKRKAKRLGLLNENDDDGDTPLVLAIQLQKKGIIPTLLINGADPNLRTASGDLPLTIAAGMTDQHDVVQLLIDWKAEVNSTDIKTALLCSAERGLHTTVGVLIQARATLNARYIRQTAIMLACREGHYRVVHKLIEARAELDNTDLDGFTGLTTAARSGYCNIVEKLIHAGATTTIKNMLGSTALQLSCMRGLPRCVKLLVNEPNIEKNINSRDDDGATPLHSATEYCDAQIIKQLLESRANLNAKDNDQRTPIIMAAFFGQVTCIKVLLENKANIEDTDNCGLTPLLTAALYNHAETCAALLSAGANIEARDNDGRWALDLCNESDKYMAEMGKAGLWTGNIIARSEEPWRKDISTPTSNKERMSLPWSCMQSKTAELPDSVSEMTSSAYSVIKAKCSQYSIDGAMLSPVIPSLRSHVEMAIKDGTPPYFTVRMLDLISDLVFGKCSIDRDQNIEVSIPTGPRKSDVSSLLRRLSEIWI